MADIPYGKIVRRTWRRANFKQLPMEHRLILCYLWSGEQGETSPIIHQFSIAAAAEALGMPEKPSRRAPEGLAKGSRRAGEGLPKGFREAFEELRRDGWFVYDEASAVIFFPKQIQFDEPTSPNHVRAMLARAQHLESPLLLDFLQALKPFIDKYKIALPKGFASPYLSPPEGLRQPLPKPLPIPEPEPEPLIQSVEATPPPKALEKIQEAGQKKSDMRQVTDHWMTTYAATAKERGWQLEKYDFAHGKDGKIIAELIRKFGAEKVMGIITAFFASDDEWITQRGGFTIGVFKSQFNKLAQSPSTAAQDPVRKEYVALYASFQKDNSHGGPFDVDRFLEYCRARNAPDGVMQLVDRELRTPQKAGAA